VSTVTSLLPLLGSGFQRRTFFFMWVPELSPASAASFNRNDSQRQNPSSSVTDCNPKSESKLCYDLRSVGQSVLVTRPHLGPKTRFLLLSDIYGFVDVGRPSLTRGWICRIQFLLALVSEVIFGPKSRGNLDYILLSQNRDFPNLERKVPVFISPRKRVTLLYPKPLGLHHWLQPLTSLDYNISARIA
jgi:hypothetical protein